MAYSNNLSKEEQKELAKKKVEKALAKIDNDVVSIFDNDRLPEFLKFAAKFHYFDVNNALLIYKQRPTATFVASFKTWEKLSLDNWGDPNRDVFSDSQKGQGIGILVPYILRKKNTVGNNVQSKYRGKVVLYLDYHVVFVFDKEQTNNIPAPIMDWDLKNNKTDSEALYNAFKSKSPFDVVFSIKENFDLNFSFEENETSSNKRKILILNKRDKTNYYKLCDYIVKYFTLESLKKLKEKYQPDEFQKIAECVSFMVSSYFGLPLDQYVFFFARSWSNDFEEMLDILSVIRDSAHKLIEELEDELIFFKDMYESDDNTLYFDDEEVVQNTFDLLQVMDDATGF